jgi:hypothetical protein
MLQFKSLIKSIPGRFFGLLFQAEQIISDKILAALVICCCSFRNVGNCKLRNRKLGESGMYGSTFIMNVAPSPANNGGNLYNLLKGTDYQHFNCCRRCHGQLITIFR